MEKRVSKLSITRDDLERRERVHRTSTNRLRQQHEHFQDNHEFIASEINNEIKRLQVDLKGIREIGNYDLANVRNLKTESNEERNNHSIGTKRKRKKLTLFKKKPKSNSKRKLNQDEGGRTVKFHPENSSQLISVENYQTAGNDMFNLSRNEKHSKNTHAREVYAPHDVIPAKHETRFSEHGVRFHEHKISLSEHRLESVRHGTRSYGVEMQLVGNKTKCYEREGLVGHETIGSEHEIPSNEHETLPHITQNTLTQDSAKSRELGVDEARNQARKRLLGKNGGSLDDHDDSITQTDQKEATVDDDIESYMYVPPDGRKRTVFLLPPLKDLLEEARKARYLRMPKRLMNHEEDPERELSVDEIFGKRI